MPKGDRGIFVETASYSMSFPCGYTFIGNKKSGDIALRLHRKKCPHCADCAKNFGKPLEYNSTDLLPTGLGKQNINILNNKFIDKTLITPHVGILKNNL
jgi:hypothetical protein